MIEQFVGRTLAQKAAGPGVDSQLGHMFSIQIVATFDDPLRHSHILVFLKNLFLVKCAKRSVNGVSIWL